MKLTLDNFRCFKNQVFEFSKINILIGENSSGKSSVLKFYLTLLQSLLDPHGLNLKLFGDYVDLGNYKELIYYHDNKKRLSFSFEFPKNYADFYFEFMLSPRRVPSEQLREQVKDEIINSLGDAVNVSTHLKYTLDENLERHSSINTEIINSTLGKLIIEHNNPEEEKLNLSLSIGDYKTCNLIYEGNQKTHELKNIEFAEEAFMSIIVGQSLRKYCTEELNDPGLFYKISYLLVAQNYLSRFIQSLKFVNPIHSTPARFYSERDKSSRYVTATLETLINILGSRSLPPMLKEQIIGRINDALKFYGLADELEIVGEKNVPVMELRIKFANLSNNITDVGYGVALQLPILFQTIMSNSLNGETILIEQPGVHLHPKLQSQLMETLIKIGDKNTYYIETHSEHIVRKLQVLIKNNSYGLTPSDVSIHYLRRDNEQIVVTTHKIDSDGKLYPNFPSGFYDSSYLLAKELL